VWDRAPGELGERLLERFGLEGDREEACVRWDGRRSSRRVRDRLVADAQHRLAALEGGKARPWALDRNLQSLREQIEERARPGDDDVEVVDPSDDCRPTVCHCSSLVTARP
jgi:hypothetical protein